MTEKLEAILASPPERDGLVIQVFVAGGGQLAEIFDDQGILVMELYLTPDASIKVECSLLLRAIKIAEAELHRQST